jgi:hypothetical protein
VIRTSFPSVSRENKSFRLFMYRASSRDDERRKRNQKMFCYHHHMIFFRDSIKSKARSFINNLHKLEEEKSKTLLKLLFYGFVTRKQT